MFSYFKEEWMLALQQGRPDRKVFENSLSCGRGLVRPPILATVAWDTSINPEDYVTLSGLSSLFSRKAVHIRGTARDIGDDMCAVENLERENAILRQDGSCNGWETPGSCMVSFGQSLIVGKEEESQRVISAWLHGKKRQEGGSWDVLRYVYSSVDSSELAMLSVDKFVSATSLDSAQKEIDGFLRRYAKTAKTPVSHKTDWCAHYEYFRDNRCLGNNTR